MNGEPPTTERLVWSLALLVWMVVAVVNYAMWVYREIRRDLDGPDR